MPSRSSDIATDAPSVSRATIERSPGRRSLGWPVSSTPGVARTAASESVALLAQPGDGLGPLRAGQLVGGRQADGAGHVLRAGPAVALLGAALLLGEDVRPVADVQRADALRALELVGAERDQVGAERLDVEVDVRRGLDGIDVEDDALARRGRRAAISAIGWIVPTSLLASMIETRIVLSLSAASSWSGSTRP